MDDEKLINRAFYSLDDGAGTGGGEPPVDLSPTQDPAPEPQVSTGNEPEPTSNASDDLTAQLEELKAANASKAEEAMKLAKELEALKKAQMTEAEKAEAEAKERAEQAKAERTAFLEDCRAVAAERAGLSEKEISLIAGATREDIQANGKKLLEALKTQYELGYEKAKKEFMKTGTPQGGSGKAKAEKSLENLFD